jgi:dolichol-phosphate mannosyltransferase
LKILPQELTSSRATSSLSIIVPTYRERENLPILIDRIRMAVTSLQMAYEIMIVDDDSGDGTVETVDELAKNGHPVRLIVRKEQRGLSSAVIRGFRESKNDLLICMDADLSHPPEAIPALVNVFEDPQVELAVGSRYVPGGSTDDQWGFVRWLNSKVATVLARPFTRIKDPMSGFFALSRKVFAKATELNPVGYKIGLELIVKTQSTNILEIPIHFADRKFGQSKLNFKEKLNYIKHLKRLADFKFGRMFQFVQFCGVGATGMGIDLFAFYLMICLNLPVPMARALAIWIAMTWNFWLNRRLTFSYSRRGNIFTQYCKYVASCSLGAIISWSTSILLIRMIPWFADRIFLAAIIGIIAGTLLNFAVSYLWVFKADNKRSSS